MSKDDFDRVIAAVVLKTNGGTVTLKRVRAGWAASTQPNHTAFGATPSDAVENLSVVV